MRGSLREWRLAEGLGVLEGVQWRRREAQGVEGAGPEGKRLTV